MLLGVGIGVPAGLALDRLIRGMRLKEETRLQNQIMATYLQALKAEIGRNLFRLEEQLREINKLPVGIFFETGVWNAIPSQIVNRVPAAIASTVPVGYYWLNKLNTLQEASLRLWTQPIDIAGPDGIGNKEKLLRQLFATIEEDSKEAAKYLNEVNRLLDEHL